MAFVQLWSGSSFPWKEEVASAREVLKVQVAIVLALNALCVSLLVGPLEDRANRMGVYVVFSEFLSLHRLPCWREYTQTGLSFGTLWLCALR